MGFRVRGLAKKGCFKSLGSVFLGKSLLEKDGARGSRTLTTLRSGDFKSPASTIPPSPHKCDILILSCFCLFVNHFGGSVLDSWLADYDGLLSSHYFFASLSVFVFLLLV